MSFAELGLSEKVLQAVAAAGYTSPTPIQAQAIPHALARRDVLGIAQTGTGKTAAFTLPMLNLLETGRARARMPRTLILEPTRELAAQVEESFVKLGASHKLSVALLIGGVSFADQDAKITRGTDVLIATPGRLLDHFERGKLLLTGIEVLVIDEADRMLDMGFIPDIERICKMVPFTRQTLFFSATMPPEIQRLTETFLSNPVKIEVARPSSTASTITQRLVASGAEAHDKRAVLRRLIRGAEDLQNAIIFCNRKRDVAILLRSLERHHFNVVALHGDMDQMSRMQALDKFRSGGATLLVASDVAARGLDIPEVSHVFNFDVPFHAEDYVHRIGRTGRAGRSGHAATIVTSHDAKALAAIESLTGQPIQWEGPNIEELIAEHPELDQPDSRRGRGRSAAKRDGETRERRGSQSGRPAPRGEAQAPREPAQREPAQREREPAQRGERTRAVAVRQHEPIRAGDRQSRHRREDDDLPVVGFGDHIPAFLLQAVNLDALMSDNDFSAGENELEIVEDVAEEAVEEAVAHTADREKPARRGRSRRAKSIAIRTPDDGKTTPPADETQPVAADPEAVPETAEAAAASALEAAGETLTAVADAAFAETTEAVPADAPVPEQLAEPAGPEQAAPVDAAQELVPAKPARRTRREAAVTETAAETPVVADATPDAPETAPVKKPARTRRKVASAETAAEVPAPDAGAGTVAAEAPAAKPARARRKAVAETAVDEAPKKAVRRTKKAVVAEETGEAAATETAVKKPAARRPRKKAEPVEAPDTTSASAETPSDAKAPSEA
ncbi:superfamily II DNA/RNA helicase [Pseudochelatococcus lubricantis]|uniref:Superfamily II DNA/RNA helicase n=1 Tax=Pseudochelatococcus lubricantis TaxID=1538102 RepID=A0ABX0V3N5_9HYPH|nr:superfamily II DNA/RNA helicase [Pseudochelatococcus lubricantis]